MKHYQLTDETIVVDATTLFRIELTKYCKWGKEGDKGGWVENETNLFGNAWVYGDAMVYGDAWVYGDAKVYGNAKVFGDAKVYGNAKVYGDANLFGNAWVYGDAMVHGDAWVYGDAKVYGNANLFGNSKVYSDIWDESPLQIQGTKNFFSMCTKNIIKIGCKERTIKYWCENFEKIGLINEYTQEQINEYGLYINLAKKLYVNK